MDTANHFSILDVVERPAFCVRDGIIVCANKWAKSYLFDVGRKISDFLLTDEEAYTAFNGGCLYLNLTSAQITSGASVTRIEDFDLFVVDTESPQLEAFALAATQLKIPMCNLVNIAESMMDEDPVYAEHRGHLRQYIYQLSRIINNMSDVNWLRNASSARHESTNFCAVFAEIMEKMDIMVTAAGCKLVFENLEESVSGAADWELLLRAVSNIMANAVKFSPKGSLIQARLVKKDKYLHFSVTDPGGSQDARCNVFTRFARNASAEDARHGIGLGMAIIHSVATDHGGTVLVDSTEDGHTRVTMTIAIRRAVRTGLKTPVQLPVNNYTSGLDISLVEFSEVLPPDAFDSLSK